MHTITLFKLDEAAWHALRAQLAARAPAARAWRARDENLMYVYVEAAEAELLPRELPRGATRIELLRHSRVDGAAAGQQARVHYVVETDVEPGYEDELNAWYDREHLPGLAAVAGTALALRYVDPIGSPRYYACYDLADERAFNSPAWLDVRATPWSSRVRPRFRNTRRTMFDPVLA
ncbi:MAG: hypothetical protein KGJ03_06875 [Betaproteobacteria bacterium]|nr:hypothetical protein [Betaproteobacteria bacterium]MBU6512073.1 hypothetical protein [Betaproteobacteria bacterium]MDE1955426.1 hypothetical protein [Betaproteobacteria bacterium]MDE2153423.1 hypothetical protein [Betaproteobacteria bacterium]